MGNAIQAVQANVLLQHFEGGRDRLKRIHLRPLLRSEEGKYPDIGSNIKDDIAG